MPIEWDTLVLEARRKAREVNPRACILTDVDVVLAMADEIERLRIANAKLVEVSRAFMDWDVDPHARVEDLEQIGKAIRLVLAAAEASG